MCMFKFVSFFVQKNVMVVAGKMGSSICPWDETDQSVYLTRLGARQVVTVLGPSALFVHSALRWIC